MGEEGIRIVSKLSDIWYDPSRVQGLLHVYHSQSGEMCQRIALKPETSVKDVTNLVAVTERPYIVALLENEKTNLYDVKNKRWIKTIQSWTGVTTKDGRWGLSAPSRGGLDLLDMKLDGEIVRNFLPRKAQGVFTIHALFNKERSTFITE